MVMEISKRENKVMNRGEGMKNKIGDLKTLKLFDFAAQFGLLIGLFFVMGEEALMLMMIAFSVFYFWLGFLLWSRKTKVIEQLKFAGNIDELILVMTSELTLSLEKKVGNYYVFRTKNRLIPNYEYFARDYGSYCTLYEGFSDLTQIDKRFEIVKMSKELRNKRK